MQKPELHYVIDSEAKAKSAAEEPIVRTRHIGETAAKYTTRDASLCDLTAKTSVFNPEYQLGKVMKTDTFEDELLLLNPKLLFQWHPDDLKDLLLNSPGKLIRKGIKLLLPNGNPSSTLAVYTWPHMPEYSIMRYRYEETYEPLKNNHYDRSMLDKNGTDLTLKRIPIPFGEAVRGWRKVLTMLITYKVLRAVDVEQKFGKGTRGDWKYWVEGNKTNERFI